MNCILNYRQVASKLELWKTMGPYRSLDKPYEAEKKIIISDCRIKVMFIFMLSNLNFVH